MFSEVRPGLFENQWKGKVARALNLTKRKENEIEHKRIAKDVEIGK